MKLFIWDFHGTLEKGNELAAMTYSNMALEKLGFEERFSREDAQRLYGLKWYEYFGAKLPNESQEKHMELQKVAWGLQERNPSIVEKNVQANDYVHEVLGTITTSGHDQIVISNTKPESLSFFVKLYRYIIFFRQINSSRQIRIIRLKFT